MDLLLQLDQCKTKPFKLNVIMSLDFSGKSWSVRSAAPGTADVWPAGSRFSRWGSFEVKDNGVIWIWDDDSTYGYQAVSGRNRRITKRRNILIIRDAPLNEQDASHSSGTVRIYDAEDSSFKDHVFPWKITAPVKIGCCGPDVTTRLVGVLKTAMEDYKRLGKGETVANVLGQGWWDISVLRDDLYKIMPNNCGCPAGDPCAGTVQVFGRCFRAGIVNYTLYGVIEELVSTKVGAALHATYWVGKNLLNFATGNISDPLYVGFLESKMVNAGIAFARGGVDAMRTEFFSIPAIPCAMCDSPPKNYVWRYTWAPYLFDRPSRY
jgi:hypothetical protein